MVKVLLYGNSNRTWYMNKEIRCPECGAFYVLEVGDRRLVSGVTSHAIWFNCPLCDTELEASKGEGGDLVTRRTEPLPDFESVR